MLPTQKTPPTNNPAEYSYLIYGEPKVGKTTFASNFPDSLFIATENGHKFLDVFRVNPPNWSGIKDTCRELITTEHNFKNIIFDTADNMYLMAAQSICREMCIDHQSDADFGKAYDRIKIEIMRVVTALGQAGLGVVFISHSDTREQIVKQTVKDGDEHIQVEMKKNVTDATLTGSARKIIRGLCDMIFYCYTDDEGNRWMRTKQTEGIIAGDRSGILPAVMPLDYDNFQQELTKER